jgi:isoleucyl-tRNA synthetase
MEAYDVTRAARAVSDFTVDQLSNWYVRRNRRRFWKSEKGKDKTAAYQTLYECIVTVSKLMAPFAPFVADELYRNLNSVAGKEKAESVHLADFPRVEDGAIDIDLERKMEHAIRIVGLVRAMRMKSNLKVRQPLKRIIVPVASERDRVLIQQVESVILEEINVKQIEFVTDESGIVRRKAKPNFKTLGPKFGKEVQHVATKVRELTPSEIKLLDAQGTLSLAFNGKTVDITPEDVEILHEDIQGWLVESDGSLTVALDTELTEELIDEGFAREFVNRVQNMRKDAGFEVTDRIRIYQRNSARLGDALERKAEYIKQETLAVEIVQLEDGISVAVALKEEDINGERATIGVERVS